MFQGGLIGLASVIYGLRADGDLLYSTGVMHLEVKSVHFQMCTHFKNVAYLTILFGSPISDCLCLDNIIFVMEIQFYKNVHRLVAGIRR